MALIKEVNTPFGVPASYWKVGYVSIDRFSKYGSISFNLFITKEAENYIDSHTICLDDPEQFEIFFGKSSIGQFRDVYHASYEYTKINSEFFADAVDDPQEMIYRDKK